MTHFDFSPLFRSSVGFDRLAQTLDQVSKLEGQQNSYPPYNIIRSDENTYRISMAVAGFGESELSIESKSDQLIVRGQKADEDNSNYIHHGIAARNFERRFRLADFVKATDAKLENGLLHIDLVREIPERLKPRQIAINGVLPEQKQVEQQAA